jgi:ParB-like chromosome segregation protein Spo0J
MKQQVKLYKIKGNPLNPRVIKTDKFKKLVKSIQEFPEMLKLRPIVVDEDMMVLGGNMRLRASKDAGLKEVWIEIAEGFTEEQKKEFIVKDNVGFGDFYAHSSKEIQELMEDSALVIIDFDKAIEKGYVKLTKDIAAAYEKNGIL